LFFARLLEQDDLALHADAGGERLPLAAVLL
jgi:hypothetical protein